MFLLLKTNILEEERSYTNSYANSNACKCIKFKWILQSIKLNKNIFTKTSFKKLCCGCCCCYNVFEISFEIFTCTVYYFLQVAGLRSCALMLLCRIILYMTAQNSRGYGTWLLSWKHTPNDNDFARGVARGKKSRW